MSNSKAGKLFVAWGLACGEQTADLSKNWRRVVGFVLLIGFSVCLSRDCLAQGEPRYLRVLDISTGQTTRLTQLSTRPYMGSPAWSPNGLQIAFDACSKGDFLKSHVYVVNVDGTWPKDIGPGGMPSWGGNRKLTIHRYGKNRGVWTVPLFKKPALALRDDTRLGSPRWNPVSGSLGCLDWGSNIVDPYSIEPTDSGERGQRLLPEGLRPSLGWCWAPDGEAVCFRSTRNGTGDLAELLIVKIGELEDEEDRVVSRLTANIYTHVSWSPDGKRILFSMRGEGEDALSQMYTVNPATDNPPKLVLGQNEACHNVAGAWSPDGKKIVYVTNPG